MTTTTVKYMNLKDTNAELRKALKAAFPGTKFSVRGHSYAGGASTNIDWTDGPTTEAVDKVAQQFAGASFDGMVDLKSYHTSQHNGECVHWGADYVFTHRSLSPAAEDAATEAVAALIGISVEEFKSGLNLFREIPYRLYELGMHGADASGYMMVRFMAEHDGSED